MENMPKTFCMRLDTWDPSLKMKELGQWKVVAIHSHKFTHVMHTLLKRSRTLCIRYS